MSKLNIYITEYVDGTLCLEPKHMHYTFREDLNYDNVEADELLGVMKEITEKLRKESLQAVFKFM